MKTSNEERIVKLNNQIAKMQVSKNLISNNKGIVSVKNADSTKSTEKILSSLKTSINNLCNGKSFKGLSFSKEVALWLVENRCTSDERRLCFNALNKVDYARLISLITRAQRAFAKEAGKDKLLKGLLGDEYKQVFDNNLLKLMW